MTFRDLPPDWEARSLAEPALAADVLDLLVSDADRRGGGLMVLITDDRGRLAQPLMIGEDDSGVTDDRLEAMRRLAGTVGHLGLEVGVVLALVRASGPFLTDDDRAWHEAALQAFRAEQVSLHGMFVVTRHVVRPFPGWAAAARSA